MNRLNLSGLNRSQLMAVTYEDRHLLVLAGPGSGKTYTITNRALYLILQKNIPPENILVVTFTKDAAVSMQQRFLRAGGAAYPVNFGTFHSIFYTILRQSGVYSVSHILNEKEKIKNMQTAIRGIFVSEDQKKDVRMRLGELTGLFLNAVSLWKNTGVYHHKSGILPDEYDSLFEPVSASYQSICREQGSVDFDDMLYLCKRLLTEHPSVRSYWSNRFSHILIDEFQDINPIQYEIVKLLTGDETILFAVGDDDQSIYGFRGSEPECIRRFVKEYAAEQIVLDINYRSTPEIVDASLAMISRNPKRFEKDLCAYGDINGEPLQIVRCLNEAEQNEKVGSIIKEHLSTYPQETIAILFRTNLSMQKFAAGLTRQEIPFSMKEKAIGIYRHKIAEDLMSYLKIIQGPVRLEDVVRIINRPSRYIGREALASSGANPITGAIFFYENHPESPYCSQKISELKVLEQHIQFLRGKSLYLQSKYIFERMGYLSFVMGECGSDTVKRSEYEEMAEFLLRESKQYECVSEWLLAQEEYERKLEEKSERDKCDVTLMTVHASKGLEFDEVMIPYVIENQFPHGKIPDKKTVEEERRVFYVAMTRAKKRLLLITMTGTKEKPVLPSRFLSDIEKKRHLCKTD